MSNKSYSLREIARVLGLSEQQVRAWEDLIGIEGSPVKGRNHCYSFRDLLQFQTLKAFKAAGLSRTRISKALEHLHRTFPSEETPLSTLRFRVEGKEVLVELEGRTQTAGGQLLLDLDAEEPRSVVLQFPDVEDRRRQRRSLAEDLAEAHLELGIKLLGAGHVVDAQRELERALFYDRDRADIYHHLSEVFSALGCTVKAQEYKAMATEKK